MKSSNLRKVCAFALCLTMMFSLLAITTHASDITVLLNGTPIVFDQPPIMQEGRTLVPMRAIFEAMGAGIEWDGETQTISGTRGDMVVIMQIGDTRMTVAGLGGGGWDFQTIYLDVPPQIVNDRTLVPVRAVAESFNADVGWDGYTQTVIITTATGITIPYPIPMYERFPNVPNFGAIFGVEVFATLDNSYIYSLGFPSESIEIYSEIIRGLGFEHYFVQGVDGISYRMGNTVVNVNIVNERLMIVIHEVNVAPLPTLPFHTELVAEHNYLLGVAQIPQRAVADTNYQGEIPTLRSWRDVTITNAGCTAGSALSLARMQLGFVITDVEGMRREAGRSGGLALEWAERHKRDAQNNLRAAMESLSIAREYLDLFE